MSEEQQTKLYRIDFFDGYAYAEATPETIEGYAHEWGKEIINITTVQEEDEGYATWKAHIDRAQALRKALCYPDINLVSPMKP